MAIPIDEVGQKAGEPAPLPITFEFRPLLRLVSPDGRYLLLLGPWEPTGIPYVVDLQTNESWPLFRGHPMQPHLAGRPHAWHPDSRQVVFEFYNNEELLLVDVETAEYTVLALTYGFVQGAAISPDGQRIVYEENGLWLVSAAGSDVRLIREGPTRSVVGWSPDGAYILDGGLGLMDPDGNDRGSLSGPYVGWGVDPAWSPNGEWVAFTGQDEGQEFGCLKQLPNPDHATCMFEGTAVFIENVYTGELRRLATGIEPVWSPDGSMLAYLSDVSGTREIWTVRMDGSAPQQLTFDDQARSYYRLIWTP